MSDTRAHDINNATDDVLGEIICNLEGIGSLKQLAGLREVNKRLAKLVNDNIYWKKKALAHFPVLFKSHINDKQINWQDTFRQEYIKTYGHLTTEQKKLITALKENNLADVKQLNPVFDDLIAEVQHNGQPTALILCTKNRDILHYLYNHIILPRYKNSRWYVWRADHEKKRSIYYWALACKVHKTHIDDLLKLGTTRLDETNFDTQETLLHLAAEFGRLDIVKLLIEQYGAALTTTNTEDKTALFSAARHGKINVIRYLAEAGMDLQVTVPYGLLIEASEYGHNNTVRFLLSKNADPMAGRAPNGLFAIHYAAYNGHLACVKTLLKSNKNLLNMLSDAGVGAIHYAAVNGHTNIVAYLLQQGADFSFKVNTTGNPENINKTAIMRAADNKHANVIALLLNAGENFNALIDYLFSADNSETLKKLISLMPERFDQAHVDALLLRAVINGKAQITEALLATANASQLDNDGYSLIHLAAMHGHDECVKKIVAHDATQANVSYFHAGNPNNGKTPIFFAQEAKNAIAVDFLLSRMSDKELFDALNFAIHNQTLALIDKITQLNPILTTKRDSQGKTPLMLAHELNHSEAASVLFKNNIFEEASPHVFTDMESHIPLTHRIIALNNTLQRNHAQDVELMIDTQNLLSTLNAVTASPESKLTSLNAYQNKHHHTSHTVKAALCAAVAAAIGIAVIAACYCAAALIPYALYQVQLSTLAIAIGYPAQMSLLSTNNFFSRTLQQHTAQVKTDRLVECARETIKFK